jgi:hypothetical protein
MSDITSMEYYARRSPLASVTLQIQRDAIARGRRAVAQGVQLPRSQRPEDHRQGLVLGIRTLKLE